MMRAKRRLGQNFLAGSHFSKKIVESVRPMSDDIIIEIGPGHGALTGLLLESGAELTAIEIDADLIPLLHEKFGVYPNFHLVEADAMEMDFCRIVPAGSEARVVANLPYYVSTPILQRLIAHRHCLSDITVMLQREVVDRIIASPGSKDYGYLSVLMQYHCEVKRLFDVPPGAFRPVPKVYSSVISMRILKVPRSTVDNEKLFLELIKILFAQRRKTILNNLKAGWPQVSKSDETNIAAALDQSEIESRRRAETLSIQEIARLSDTISRMAR